MSEQNTPEILDLTEVLRVRREKLAALMEAGQNPFEITVFDQQNHTQEVVDGFEQFENQNVILAGRLMQKRIMGKASFANLMDKTGSIQLYVRRDELGEELYTAFKQMDIGDIIGVTGTVFRTHAGEVTVKASQILLLSKSLQVLPEKYHGLKDTDLRYRQRYVDLIVNPEVKQSFVIRSKAIAAIRAYLDQRDFLEVETPILNTIAGGTTARPFTTHHNTLDIDMYLRIAPELYLKRLIVGGLEKVYEMGRMFRNEGMSVKHNPEFTMMEVYQAYTDYKGMMELTEGMLSTVARQTIGSAKLTYQGTEIDLTPPWQRKTMLDAVEEYSGVDFKTLDQQGAIDAAKAKHLEVKKSASWGDVLTLFFDEYVEPNLIQPTFIYDYPVELSPLAKRKASDPAMTERFEIFITGREYGNAYSELNDPIDQKGRFLAQVAKRETGDDEAMMMDEDYVTALEYGMPPTGGLGIGIDRFVMLLTDAATIRDVLLFPTMKPLK